MKRAFLNHPYRIICFVFALIIIIIFAYSFVFDHVNSYPVPSGSQLMTGNDSPSTGLSRSFSAITHFRLREANALNPYGLRIFLFFLIQLVMRISGLAVSLNYQYHRGMVIIDILLSVALFVIAFLPFLKAIMA